MTIHLSDYEKGRRLRRRLRGGAEQASASPGADSGGAYRPWQAQRGHVRGDGTQPARAASSSDDDAHADPRYFRVWPIGAPSEEEKGHHFLGRFWSRLPADKNIAVFDRSWYGRVLVERVEELASERELKARPMTRSTSSRRSRSTARHGDDQDLRPHHTGRAGQAVRPAAGRSPFKRWKTGHEDYRNRARRDDYLKAMHDMFAKTDTRGRPGM